MKREVQIGPGPRLQVTYRSADGYTARHFEGPVNRDIINALDEPPCDGSPASNKEQLGLFR